MNYFDSSQLIIAGDLSSRIGTLMSDDTNYNYIDNPDVGINGNGNNLLEIYNRTSDLVIVNGFMMKIKNLIQILHW